MLRDVRDVVRINDIIEIRYSYLVKEVFPTYTLSYREIRVFNTRYAVIIAPYTHLQFIYRIAGASYWCKADALFEYIDRQFLCCRFAMRS